MEHIKHSGSRYDYRKGYIFIEKCTHEPHTLSLVLTIKICETKKIKFKFEFWNIQFY